MRDRLLDQIHYVENMVSYSGRLLSILAHNGEEAELLCMAADYKDCG